MANDGATKPEAKDLPERLRLQRTCVGCREVAPTDALVRFAIDVEGGVANVVPDVAHKLGGRGASVHASRACLELAVKRGGFAKAASARVDVDAATLAGLLEAQLLTRAKGLLLGAIRGKLAIVGADGTEKAVAERRVVALVLAGDASPRTSGVAEAMTRLGGRAIPLMTKAELGKLLGRDEVAVIGLVDDGIAAALAHVAEQLRGVRSEAG